MGMHSFSNESYSTEDRSAVWCAFLGEFGLVSKVTDDGCFLNAAAAMRGSAEGAIIARISSSSQIFAPARQIPGLPLVMLSLEDHAELKMGKIVSSVSAGDIVILPRQGDWQMAMHGVCRAVALSVNASAFASRKISAIDFGAARVVKRQGLAAILAQTMEASAQALATFLPAEWAAIEQSLSGLLLTLLCRPDAHGAEPGNTASRAALVHRICQTIEGRLDESDLSPARVAQLEGISERYLQNLIEDTGASFTHYVRELRLLRARRDLAEPALARQAVSEIAYRYGFKDAAYFSRAFSERFGTSPRAFRRQEAKRDPTVPETGDRRGWPRGTAVAARLHPPQEKRANWKPYHCDMPPFAGEGPRHHHLPVNAATVHWGFFSRSLYPLVEIASGDTVTVETLTQHASDDPERMISNDPGAESVFHWTSDTKNVDRRGAGPMEANVYGRGAGEGFGVHICTGPIAIKDAQPGDVVEIRILDIIPRPSQNPQYEGRVVGSHVSAWWGYHHPELLQDPKPRETVTIFEIFPDDDYPYACAAYSYLWRPQTDPFGVVHEKYDYPGVMVDSQRPGERRKVLEAVRIPLRPHFGVIAVAPKETGLVDSIPPAYFGGNLDNWRLGKGAAVYLPVSVAGALLSIGDPHIAQGDGELAGTAIECSLTGTLQVILHKKSSLAGKPFADLTYPLIETRTDWVLTGFSHPNYILEYGAKGQAEVYANASLDLAMKDAFRKTRRFLMSGWRMSEDEAIAVISVAVDFGVTQVVDGNWGVHAILNKRMLPSRRGSP